MTIPAERIRACKWADDFLTDIILGKYKRVPEELKEIARRILRHYPDKNLFDYYFKHRKENLSQKYFKKRVD